VTGDKAQKSGTKTWIVRDRDGKIYGPFNTDQVLVQIDRGYFMGGEDVALYPGGKWIPISNAPEFYDRLLDALSQESADKAAEKNPDRRRPDRTNHKNPGGQNDDRSGMGQNQKPGSPGSAGINGGTGAAGTGASGAKTAKTGTPGNALAVTRPSAPIEIQNNLPAIAGGGKQNQYLPAVIELTDLKKLENLEDEADEEKRSPLPVILVLLGLAAAAVVFFQEEIFGPAQTTAGRIRLIAPRKNQAEMPIEKIKDKYRRAIAAFQTDLFSGYQRAQSELVEVVEGLPKDPEKAAETVEVYSTLCLSYRELWPYSYQDAQDMKVLREVLQDAKRLDPAGLHGATCEAVQLLLAGRYREADQLAASRLEEEGQAPVLFEMRADAYLSVRDNSNAAIYFERARLLWPAWQKIAVGEARARARTKNFGQAMTLYRGVIQQVPPHPVAKIELGLIEFKEFDKQDQAIQLLSSALNGDEKIPRTVESAGWLGMAEIALRRNQRKLATEHARKAYGLNTGSVEARDFLSKLAGEAEVKGTKVAARELVFLGDQHAKSGDCFQAQAEYKAAFDAEPKNGVAAMKAGKCLWQLNQSGEAIEWMKKAINAEPKLSAAYVELADYYALRYDYQSAFKILQRIQQQQPNNYEVMRGYAQVELRRNNFEGAVQYGNRALKLYGTDLETFLLMAKAHFGLKQLAEAQSFAQKTLEIDGGNVEAHSLLGKIEAGIRGVEQGAAYLTKLMNQIVLSRGAAVPPAAIAYRVALAEIYMYDDKLPEAEQAARQAVSLDPNSKEALVTLGRILQGQAKVRDSLEMYLKAAVLDPADADPIFYAGHVYIEVGKFADAIAQFQRVLKVNSRYPRAHASLGRAYLRQNQFQEALNEAKNERDMNPELGEAYLLAGDAFYGLRQYSNCTSEYQKATSKGAKNANILVKMARCARLSGSSESAQSYLREAQSLESGNPEVYKEQGALFHTKGQADEAIAAYDTYLRLVPSADDKAEIEDRIRKVQSGDFNVEGP
jgi:tetratricopeptide (TPR) repeat protein